MSVFVLLCSLHKVMHVMYLKVSKINLFLLLKCLVSVFHMAVDVFKMMELTNTRNTVNIMSKREPEKRRRG